VKKFLISFLMIIMSVSVAMATWITDFEDNYNKLGIQKAVEFAKKDGIDVYEVIGAGKQLDVTYISLISAAYCAKYKGKDIRDAAFDWEMTKRDVALGYKKAKEECNIAFAESQASLQGKNTGTPSSTETPRTPPTRRVSPYQYE